MNRAKQALTHAQMKYTLIISFVKVLQIINIYVQINLCVLCDVNSRRYVQSKRRNKYCVEYEYPRKQLVMPSRQASKFKTEVFVGSIYKHSSHGLCGLLTDRKDGVEILFICNVQFLLVELHS